MVTVEEIWKEVLPEGTELLAGERYLRREVSWVQVVKPRPPGLDTLRGDELILLSTAALPSLDLTLSRAIRSLAGKASALAVQGKIPGDALQEAEGAHLPLFELPVGASLAATEQDALRFLSEQRTEWYQRKHAVLHELTALAVQGQGLTAIARHMGDATGHAVTFEDEAGHLLAWYVPSAFPPEHASRVRAWMEGSVYGADTAGATPALDEPLPLRDGLDRLAAPVTVKDGPAGTVSLLGPVEHLDGQARLVLEAGATAGAIELAREHAVQETVHRIQGDLISDLVAGRGDRQELERRARRLGHDLDATRIAIAFSPVPDGGDGQVAPREALASLRRRLTRALTTHEVEAPSHLDEGLLAVFYPVSETPAPATLKVIGERLHRDLADAVRGYRLYGGISRIYSGVESFRLTFHEARRALELGRALAPDRTITYFGDLRLYRLLFAMRETGEMREFYDELLGRLASYDQEKNAELIPTLETYLCANNTTEAAIRLNLHRNSLLYRLRRIHEITGLDLEDPETRLALHLALRIGEALRADLPPSA